jgi:hypothetical protein
MLIDLLIDGIPVNSNRDLINKDSLCDCLLGQVPPASVYRGAIASS